MVLVRVVPLVQPPSLSAVWSATVFGGTLRSVVSPMMIDGTLAFLSARTAFGSVLARRTGRNWVSVSVRGFSEGFQVARASWVQPIGTDTLIFCEASLSATSGTLGV